MKIQRCLKWLTVENRKYDKVQVFINKYQRLTIFIHCNFVSSRLIFEIFARNKTTCEVNLNKHDSEDSSHADARSESNKMVNRWQFWCYIKS